LAGAAELVPAALNSKQPHHVEVIVVLNTDSKAQDPDKNLHRWRRIDEQWQVD
jgi:hypothetical protein